MTSRFCNRFWEPRISHSSWYAWFCGFLLAASNVSTNAQILDSLALFGTSFDVDVYGNIIVVDAESNLLTYYSPNGKNVRRQIGGQGWGKEEFDRPSGVWSRNGMDIFVADYGNSRIQRFDRTLSFVSSLYTREDADKGKRFGYPSDVALSRLGDLFICDTENARILKVRGSTQVDESFGGFDAGKGRLLSPAQVEIGANDAVYVLDKERIVVFDVFGNFLREFAPGLFRNPSMMFATAERFLVLDGDILYIFDRNDHPSEPLSIRTLTHGRFSGNDVRSLILKDWILYLLTERGVYLLQLPQLNSVTNKPE